MSRKNRSPYAAIPWTIMWVMAPTPLYIWAIVFHLV